MASFTLQTMYVLLSKLVIFHYRFALQASLVLFIFHSVCPPYFSLLNPVLFSLPSPFLEFLAHSSFLFSWFLRLLQVMYYNLRTQSWAPQIRENITQETFSRSQLPPSITFSSSIYLPANVMIHFFSLWVLFGDSIFYT